MVEPQHYPSGKTDFADDEEHLDHKLLAQNKTNVGRGVAGSNNYQCRRRQHVLESDFETSRVSDHEKDSWAKKHCQGLHHVRLELRSHWWLICATIFALVFIAFLSPSMTLPFHWRSESHQNRKKATLATSINGTFKIALFADLHYGENPEGPWGPRQDLSSTRVQKTILSLEEPNLVIYLGDLLTGNNIRYNVREYWKKVVQPCKERNIPWAFVLGNHDTAPFEQPNDNGGNRTPATWTAQDLLDYDNRNGGNLSQTTCEFVGKLGGLTNYVLRVYLNNQSQYHNENMIWSELEDIPERNSATTQKRPKSGGEATGTFELSNPLLALLYFVDTGGGSFPSILGKDIVDWVEDTAMKNAGNARSSLLFMHIPSPDYKNLFNQPTSSSSPDGKHTDRVECVGEQEDDGVDSTLSDTGIVNSVMCKTNISHAFVGHNHGNDWCCPLKQKRRNATSNGFVDRMDTNESPILCFARHTGYGGYGSWDRGSRIIKIDKSGTIGTWVRLENGTAIHEFGGSMMN